MYPDGPGYFHTEERPPPPHPRTAPLPILGSGPVGTRRGPAYLAEAVGRQVGQQHGLHGGHVSEPHLGDVEGAHHVSPAARVRLLQSAALTRTQLTPLPDRTGQRSAFTANRPC